MYSYFQESAIEKTFQSNNTQKIINLFKEKIPSEWGMDIKGIKTRIDTKEKVIALTFDACGDYYYNEDYDEKLINFLIKEKICGTLFLSGIWIDNHPETASRLSKNPLFEIENHGLNHKPLSVDGQYAYGIRGTESVEEVIDEVEKNALKIKVLTGKKPSFFRSGTAHYDDIAIMIVNALGYDVVNFSVNGDSGAKASKSEIMDVLLSAESGSIIIFHMNHPEGDTAEGIIEAVPKLKQKGFKFVKLGERRKLL